MNNEFITQKEAAEALMLSIGTIRNLIAKGELQAYQFGKQVRITKESLTNYISRSKLS